MNFQELIEKMKANRVESKKVDPEKAKAFFEQMREVMKQYTDKQ